MTHEPHDTSLVPNHHGNHKGFSGLTGWIASLTMRTGRNRTADLAIQLADVVPGDRLVDIGCGPGAPGRRAARIGAGVTGVDPSAVMLRMARRDDRRGTVTWREGAAEALPLPDDACEVAWSLSTVHHWPDLNGGLSEVRRVLVPGGRFVAIERRVRPGATGLAGHGWTEAQATEFARMCKAAGFGGAQVTTHDTRRGTLLAVRADL